MDLPLVLVRRRDGALVYRIPFWFRAVMGLIFVLVTTSLFLGEQGPGTFGWIVIAILLLALLYQEIWIFDAARGEIRHSFGLLVVARSLVIPLAQVRAFRLVPWVRGGIRGSAEERADNDETLAASRGKQVGEATGAKRRPMYRKPYLSLTCESADSSQVINMVPSRRAASLRAIAESMAKHCGKPVEEA